MAALRAQQNREWRERREEARKEEVAPLIHLSNYNHDDDDDVGNDDDVDIILKFSEQELSGRCCDVERDCGVEEALRQELRQRSSLHCLVLWATL